MHWRGGKEESKLVQVSGWDALLLGITTIWGNRLLGTVLFVVGEWDREGIRLNFDVSV